MILKRGHLAQSTDVKATTLERDVPLIIEAAILDALTPLQTSIDTLTMRVEDCENRQGATSDVLALKAEVADLRKDEDYLKSTDFTSLIQAADDMDDPDTSGIPPNSTGDAHRDEAVVKESDAETDEEQIGLQEEKYSEICKIL
ncbi:hypothetical protein H5410_021906 [Solanum commersonii]|uniref:Polyprotein protein n=1 Tax=Solanum commersonii TaxID=4109 RepID=A0A9J5ZCP0_SOLCO|nr:hypothetical protein H5410_021906 [Solanum commersonii]